MAKKKKSTKKAEPEKADVDAPPQDEPPFEDVDAVLDDDLEGEPMEDESSTAVLDEDDEARAAPETSLAADTEDLTGAIDLGGTSTPELRDLLLAQTLAHAEAQDARYRVPFSHPRPAGRLKVAVAAVLLLIAATVAVAPPGWVRPEPSARIDAARRARDIRTALLLQAQQIDAYWVLEQRLPASLDELPARLPGVRYVRSGNRLYQLIAYEPDGNPIVYDSGNPAPEFARLRPSWVRGEEQ